MDRPNLTVLTHALVTRVVLSGKRAVGVEIIHNDKLKRVDAELEVVRPERHHTPKVLMQSGIGDHAELQRLGIPLVEHLPGVGENFQDHVGVPCIWEYAQAIAPRNNACEATPFWKSDSRLDTPDLQPSLVQVPLLSAAAGARSNPLRILDVSCNGCKP
jgi:choline dehydrogenase